MSGKKKTIMTNTKLILKIRDHLLTEIKSQLMMIGMISHLAKQGKRLRILKLVEKCQKEEALKSKLMI